MDIITYALCNKKIGSKSPAIVETTATASTVTVNADTTNNNAVQSVLLHGATYQDGTSTPDTPIDIIPLEGYDTMTGTGENATYSRSAGYDPAADQYYAIQVESGTDTVWVGTAEKIAPLYDGDTIDFAKGIVTRNNDTESLAIADMDNVTEEYPGWLGDWHKYNNSGVNKEMLTTDGNYSSIGAENYRVCRVARDSDVLYRPYGQLDDRTQSEWKELYPDLVINFVLKLAETATENVELNRSMSGFNGELTISSTGDLTVQFSSDTKAYIDGHSGGVPAVNSVNGKIGNVIIDTADLMRESDEADSDFDISDINGNVILRIADGDIQTKNFDSRNHRTPIEEYAASSTYAAGATNTLVIAHQFSKGDKVYYHLSDNQQYYDYGKYASYYEGSKLIASNRRGSNGYFEHIISQDVDSVSISIDGNQYSNGQALKLYVYKVNGEVEPKIVTVAADGTGMYTTPREAIESITDANSVTNPYIVEIYPGIYDTLDGYSDEEIASADIGGGYSQTSFVGLKITDGISLRGMGNADEVILTAELSTDDWTSAVRGNISTLNIQGSSTVENLTITATNLRYCVHDDFNSPINTREKRVLRNLYLYGSNVAYAPYGSAYGAGMTVPRDYIVENCEFNYGFGIHSNGGHTFGCNIIMENCSAHRAYFSDVASSVNDAVHNIFLHNCNFDRIELNHTANDVGQHMMLHGNSFEDSIIKTAPSDLYDFGTVTKHPTNLGTGTLVAKNSSGDSIVATDNISIAYGVVIGNDGVCDYVQRSGYIASNRFELSDLTVGDYVTIDENSKIVDGGTVANAIGIVTAVDTDDVAFIKLLI